MLINVDIDKLTYYIGQDQNGEFIEGTTYLDQTKAETACEKLAYEKANEETQEYFNNLDIDYTEAQFDDYLQNLVDSKYQYDVVSIGIDEYLNLRQEYFEMSALDE